MNFKSLIPVLLLVLSPFSLVAANSGFGETCNSIRPYNDKKDWIIFANCREPSGIYKVGVSININSCFANSNGKLVAREWGRFGDTCDDIKLDGTILRAKCGNGKGGRVSTSIDTNKYIGNMNGHMKCFGKSNP